MRCAEFYICLTTPIYFTRASPPPRQEERDANQTCWLDCDHDRIGWHRGCGGLYPGPVYGRGGGFPRPPHGPRLASPRFRVVRAGGLWGPTPHPAPPRLRPACAPGGGAAPPVAVP